MPKPSGKVLTIDQLHQIKIEANKIKRREFAEFGFDWTPDDIISEDDIRTVIQAIYKLEVKVDFRYGNII
jgi:hypothetical protein